MLKRLISKDWFYSENAQDFERIDLPLDTSVSKKRSVNEPGGKNNGFFPDHGGVYVKHLNFDAGTHYLLDLDGSYMNTQIFLNENYVAFHPYGYTPFLAELTPYILENRINKLRIILNPFHSTSRWYTGNGIYRDVFLWEGGKVRMEPWNMFVSTVSADETAAKLRLRYTLTADTAETVSVRFSVLTSAEECVRTEELTLELPEGKSEHELFLDLSGPLLWDTENPNLYTLKTEISVGDTLTDTAYNTFGIRTVTADAKNGLRLNGKRLKLRGGCIHHDHGVLGSAAFPAAEERKVRLLKEAGYNAIRCAHNPPSLAFLEVCDRLGMVVMDEAFDSWNKRKTQNDYHMFFEDWWKRDISYMVKRDRNHPCIFSYSIGNEILEIDGTSDAAGWAKRLADEVRKYDDTKFVTSGIQKGFARHPKAEPIDPEEYRQYVAEKFNTIDATQLNAVTLGYEQALDIIGCNYYYNFYDFEHEMYPDRVLWSSETQVRSLCASWKFVEESTFVIGDFTWTAYDNMGEVGVGRGIWARDGIFRRVPFGDYPWRTCHQGDYDLCGYRRPQSYFREAVWIGGKEPRIFTTDPEHFHEGVSGSMHHWYDVEENWTFDDKYVGRPITVETYTDAEEVLWLINGREVGRTPVKDCIARMDTIYEKGEITAVACKAGAECSRYTLSTVGEKCAVNVVPEKDELLADNRDLCYLRISIVDGQNRLVVAGESEIRCLVENGELLGIFSGNPASEDQYGSDTCHTFGGRAVAIVRAKDPGTVKVHVYTDNLAPGHADITAK